MMIVKSVKNEINLCQFCTLISLYCTAAHGPVTSTAFILYPIFILRPTCNSALNDEHYYSYLLPFGLLLQLSFLLILSNWSN